MRFRRFMCWLTVLGLLVGVALTAASYVRGPELAYETVGPLHMRIGQGLASLIVFLTACAEPWTSSELEDTWADSADTEPADEPPDAEPADESPLAEVIWERRYPADASLGTASPLALAVGPDEGITLRQSQPSAKDQTSWSFDL